jgi:hypothetical protein
MTPGVNGNEIREGSADIDADPKHRSFDPV